MAGNCVQGGTNFFALRMKDIFDNHTPESFKDFRIGKWKRVFDVVVSVIVLIFFAPFMLLIAIAIKLESRGPVIFSSTRIGTGYDLFTFYKFRSMRDSAEKEREKFSDLNLYLINKHKTDEDILKKGCPECERLGYNCSTILYIEGIEICENWYLETKKRMSEMATFFKVQNDPRVTRVGRFIRKFNLDELPQLINVIKGDMSIVGNRPLPVYEAEKLTNDQMAYRFLAPAGITGLWQISKNRFESEEDRIKLDNMYAMVASPTTDIKILLKTLGTFFNRYNY